jgi:RHS repeat-associated protein
LGNVRLSYGRDPQARNEIKILEENHYYPYGLKHTNYNANLNAFKKDNNDQVQLTGTGLSADLINKYKFNGCEYQDELGLNLYDMDFRDYDPAIGRWFGIDPVTHFDQSPYNAFDGNPVTFADPSGADGVVPNIGGTIYGMSGQSASANYDGPTGGHIGVWMGAHSEYEMSWDGHNGSQTFYGGEAINVFCHFAMANGYTRDVFTYKTAAASGGIGGGFIDYTNTGSIRGDGLNIYGNGGDALAGNGIGFGRGSGSIDATTLAGGGVIDDLLNLGQAFGMLLDWMYGGRETIAPPPQFQPQPFSIVVPAYVTVPRYDYTATDAFGYTESSVHRSSPRDTTVRNGNQGIVRRLNIRDSVQQSVISSMKNTKHKKIYGY